MARRPASTWSRGGWSCAGRRGRREPGAAPRVTPVTSSTTPFPMRQSPPESVERRPVYRYTDGMPSFRRDRMTWVAYAMLAWFAYLQASRGLVAPHLRDELHLSYSSVGLHIAAFAAGSLVSGFMAAPAERAIGRKPLFWLSAVPMVGGTILLTAGRIEALTVGALLVMGIGGGLLLITVQA